jgi:carbamoyltransferase
MFVAAPSSRHPRREGAVGIEPGRLYSAFTYYTGFRVNSGEFKLMGLATYGEYRYADLILDKLIDLKDDGSFRIRMESFNYCQGLTMPNRHFNRLFGKAPAQA